MEYKLLLGTTAVVIELASYAIYFFGIWKGKTKPHAFTWLVWGILNVVAFAAVLISGGEAGSWVLGVNALACLIISGIGFYQKHVVYDTHDWLALLGALVGVFLWWLTSNPLYAVILVCLSDGIGSVPIFRKAYRAPFEENVPAFAVGILYYPLAILALESLSLTTWLYPAFVILLDGALVILILARRKQSR
ncbi:MAG: hypothetical protein WCT29_02955 [Candidatus Paceibacterota bacterium]|jgi:hypothetical protein